MACTTVELKAGGVKETTMDLSRDRSFVRLLDKDGEPIAGASITLRDIEHMPNLLARSIITDDSGVAELPATGLDEFMLEAGFPSGGFMAPRRVLRPKTEEPLELVWDGGKGMFLGVFDGSTPLEGLEIWVHEKQSGFPAVTLNVPSDGHYERPNIGAGTYFAQPHSSWVWFRRAEFELDDKGTPIHLEFRRLGDLVVAVKDAYGNPVSGLAVELSSDEFGESVADWLATGRITSTTGLVTDDAGEVHLAGLPHGAYTWSVGGESGSTTVAVGSGSLLAVQLVE